MKILLDTSIYLWLLYDDKKLSDNTLSLLYDVKNEIYVSTVSLWEVAIKNAKWPDELNITPDELYEVTKGSSINILNLTPNHILKYKDVYNQNIHKDPFDNLIIAAAMSENMSLLTSDSNILKYNNINLIAN